MKYFEYGDKELNYLKKCDEKLCEVINKVGKLQIEVNPDVFEMLIYSIIGQQLSNKAQETIFNRVLDKIKVLSAENLLNCQSLRDCGLSQGKVEYVKGVSKAYLDGELNFKDELSDDDIIKKLTQYKGVGVWTAEMILIFSMQRKNILSYNDLIIKRGLEMLYGIEKIDKKTFEIFREKFSPYCSIASFYIWRVGNGKV